MIRALALAAAAVTLAACGQKGPLRIPETKAKPATSETPATPAAPASTAAPAAPATAVAPTPPAGTPSSP